MGFWQGRAAGRRGRNVEFVLHACVRRGLRVRDFFLSGERLLGDQGRLVFLGGRLAAVAGGAYAAERGFARWRRYGEGALPAALYSQGRLLVSGANSVAYLLEAASGKLLDSAATASAGLASCASSASAGAAGEGEALAVAASDGTVCLVEAADSSLRIENSVSLGCALSSCAPVCVDDTVYVGGSDGSVYRLAKDGTALSLRADAQIPVCSSAISELLPVAYGERASAMTLGVYAQAEDGSLFYIEQTNDSKASVRRLRARKGRGTGLSTLRPRPFRMRCR